jgi:phosphohistidine swiveling domain-containing protein
VSPVTDHESFYKKYISLTEWLEAMGHANTEAIRLEDNEKRERLKVLNQIIGLPYDKPYQFTAQEVVQKPDHFNQFLAKHGKELCAIRLIPLEPSLPKMRLRGKSIEDAVEWFDRQDIAFEKYRVDFIPHPHDNIWGTIFVLNSHGAFGEIIKGSHTQLTQGYQDAEPPIAFSFDFDKLELSRDSRPVREHLQDVLRHLHVKDQAARAKLSDELKAKFTKDYLHGYFETTSSSDFGLVFIDYNRILGQLYQDFTGLAVPDQGEALLRGQVGSAGKAKGKVRVVDNALEVDFQDGEILVCPMTTPEYLPLMQKAAAIVTDIGGILSHAAIVARELGKPCLTATGNATRVLSDGMMVEVDADAGVVKANS